LVKTGQAVTWSFAACVGLAVAAFCFNAPVSEKTFAREPGADHSGGGSTAAAKLVGEFKKGADFSGTPSDYPGAWPNFRGSNHDAVSPETVRLARNWGTAGPRQLWAVELGEGYAGPAVRNGRVYLLDYDRENQADVMRCLALSDGRELWRRAYGVSVKRNHGMSRTVPAVTDDWVASIGPKCHVVCLNALTGDFLWGLDLAREYGTTVPPWYAGQCPLLDGGRVILAPAGDDVLLMALDARTGEVLWKTPNPDGWKMSHASVAAMTAAGRRMFVYCAVEGVVGVDAEDGKILWRTEEWRISIAVVPTPVPVGDDRIFLCGGYDAGAALLQVMNENGKFVPKILYRLKPKIFGSAQQTPIFYQGHLYGVRPDERMVCLNLDGEVLWTSDKRRFGLGPYLVADGLLFVVNDRGKLTLAEASPKSFNLLAEAQVLHGHEAWGPLAIAGGLLLVRDFTRMVCLDVSAE
jgi:outer membrane protein assembly factor BamB